MRWSGLLPFFLAALLYGALIPGSGWILDDVGLIEKHPHPKDILGEWLNPTYQQAYGRSSYVWRPLVTSLWRAMELLVEREPWAYRLLNLCLLIWLILYFQRCARLVSVRAAQGAALPVAFSLLLVVFPATLASVCWNSAAFELAATGLGLMALECFLTNRIFTGSLFFLLGCFAKESLLPAGLVLIGCTPAKKQGFIWITGAGVLYKILHFLVTREAMPPVNLAESLAAWVQAMMLPLQFFSSPQAHLFNPAETIWVLPLLLGLLLLFWKIPQSRAGIGVWALLLAPAAVGVPLIGILPARYALAPAAFALVFLCQLSASRTLLGLIGGLGLVYGGLVGVRGDDWKTETTLWEATLELEPGNPYALRQQAALLWRYGPASERKTLLQNWATAIETLPRPLAFFDPTEEHYRLAQAAFLSAEYQLALIQVQAYLTQKKNPPTNAWCLLADSLERSGASPQEVASAAQHCR